MVTNLHILRKDGIRLKRQKEALALVQHIDFLALFFRKSQGIHAHHKGEEEGARNRHDGQAVLALEGLLDVLRHG